MKIVRKKWFQFEVYSKTHLCESFHLISRTVFPKSAIPGWVLIGSLFSSFGSLSQSFEWLFLSFESFSSSFESLFLSLLVRIATRNSRIATRNINLVNRNSKIATRNLNSANLNSRLEKKKTSLVFWKYLKP